MRKYKVGLALSGGSVKGLAHLGVLKSFEDNGIEVNVMSGVSAGSLIAALYADGNSVEDILAFFKKAKFFDMVDFNFNIFKGRGGGLTAIRPFKEKLKKMMRSSTFEDLNIPIIDEKNIYLYYAAEYRKIRTGPPLLDDTRGISRETAGL